MKFILLYDGDLRSNGDARHKHEIREVFHAQLLALWQQDPLRNYHDSLTTLENPDSPKLIVTLAGRQFAPLVGNHFRLVAELDILMLRPEPPGSVLTQGGDIDNRLKTLFDALRMPRVESEIPAIASFGPHNAPFHCLLEDDALVTEVAVRTERLLTTPPSRNYVRLVITVKTKAVVSTYGNLGLV